MPPVSKPTQRRGKEHQLENTLESEDELAVQSSRATSSRKAAPKDQPSLSASNPPTHNNAGDPEKQNPTAHRTSADTLDQLSDIHIHPNLPSTASPRKKSSRSPARAPSPSKESSLDESQYSKGSRTVTKKESLALMTPPVFFAPFSTINEPRGALPPMAQRLWTNYIRSACSSAAPYIPDTLKNRLDNLSGTPSGRQPPIAPNAFLTPARHRLEPLLGEPSGPFTYHPADHETIAGVVFDVHRMADMWRNKCHEDFWIDVVVSPLVHLVRKLTNFHENGDKSQAPRLAVVNLKTSEIKPTSLISTSDEDLFKALNKKIDLAIGLHLLQYQQRELQKRKYRLRPTSPSINQVQSYFHLTPMITNIEVKKKYQNRDPLIQLGAWLVAEFKKRCEEGWPMEMPAVAITIDQDDWQLYIVHYIPKDGGSFELSFVGPRSIGNTSDYEGIFRV
ncbi:MAG: hypothetical protein LQ346_009050, partial [Caloplaca aetnensis]